MEKKAKLSISSWEDLCKARCLGPHLGAKATTTPHTERKPGQCMHRAPTVCWMTMHLCPSVSLPWRNSQGPWRARLGSSTLHDGTKRYNSRWVGQVPEGARRREVPQRNPVASLVKMREQFKPSEAASNPGELAQAAAGFTPPSLSFLPPSLSTSPVVLSSLPDPALTSKAELSYRITWGFYK